MKNKSNHILCLLFLATLLLNSSCRKSEEIGLGNAGLVMAGSHNNLELVSLQPTDDGGYLLTAHTRQNEDQDIAIFKYDDQLVLQWERVIGGKYDDIVQKLFIDRDQNILVTGFAYGFNQDTLSSLRSKDWIPYYHLLNSSGITVWENIQYFNVYSLPNQTINDVVQNDEGNYLISGKLSSISFDTNGNLLDYGLIPVILNIQPNGQLLSSFHRSKIISEGSIESIFYSNNKVYAFGQNLESKKQAEYFSINPKNMNGMNRCKLLDTIDWQSSAQVSDPILATLKVQAEGRLKTFIVNRNWVYRYELNITQQTLTSEHVPIVFKDIIWAGQSETTFLFVSKNGWVYETDFNLKVINSFISQYPINQIHKHKDGGYVGAANKNRAIQLIRFNATGQAFDYE